MKIQAILITSSFGTLDKSVSSIRIAETEISAKSNSNEQEALCGDIRKLWDGKKSFCNVSFAHGRRYESLYIEYGILKNHMTSLRDSEAIAFKESLIKGLRKSIRYSHR